MDKQEQIKFRKLLKKNGFIKSDTSNNKDLMEFIKYVNDDFIIIIYTYEIVEVYFDTASNFVAPTIEHFSNLYKEHTGLIFNQ